MTPNSPPPRETRGLPLPTGTLAYHLAGSGLAAVLIHPLGRGAEDFDALAPLLRDVGFRTLQPEPRGIGASAPLSGGDTLHEMAADIASMIKAETARPTSWWTMPPGTGWRACWHTIDTAWERVAERFPTLYVGAAEDVISPPPSLSDLTERLGPEATGVVIPRAGHALLPEQPEAVASELIRWVSRLG